MRRLAKEEDLRLTSLILCKSRVIICKCIHICRFFLIFVVMSFAMMDVAGRWGGGGKGLKRDYSYVSQAAFLVPTTTSKEETTQHLLHPS